jgi:hypothetical protein
MHVYVVEQWWDYEGGQVLGVYATERAALGACRQPSGDPIERWHRAASGALHSMRKNERDYDAHFRISRWEVTP